MISKYYRGPTPSNPIETHRLKKIFDIRQCGVYG
jgi:hypothetical protein